MIHWIFPNNGPNHRPNRRRPAAVQNVPLSQRFRHHCGNDRLDTARSSPRIHRISSRFKYVYSAKTSLQAATCLLLSRLHHEATAETKQITAACCSHSACTSLRLNSGLCTSVIYTCAATLC